MKKAGEALVTAICESMGDDPLSWRQGNFRLIHLSGVELWTANGFWYYGLEAPRELRFGVLGKLRFSRALGKWRETMKRMRFFSEPDSSGIDNAVDIIVTLQRPTRTKEPEPC